MSGRDRNSNTTSPEETLMENATVTSTLGFRQLSRKEGRRWLSTINRSTPNSAATHPSASAPQSPFGASNSQSELMENRNMDLQKKQNQKMMIMPQEEPIQGTCNAHNFTVTDHTHIVKNSDKQRLEREGKDAELVMGNKDKGSDDINHVQEKIKDKDQQNNILELECVNRIEIFTDRFDEESCMQRLRSDSKSTNENVERNRDEESSKTEATPKSKEKIMRYDDDDEQMVKGVEKVRNIKEKALTDEHLEGKKDGNLVDEAEPREQLFYAKNIIMNENGDSCGVESNMCHQCQKNDRGRLVRCRKCTTKRYCVPCITTWYPKMTEEMFADCCPVCRENCNCKSCLHDVPPRLNGEMCSAINDDQKVQHSKYILQMLLPFLKRLNEEQLKEMEMEASIKGCSKSEVNLANTYCEEGWQIYCDCCKALILDLHRSCPQCHFDLCLTCCWELRDGHLHVEPSNISVETDTPDPAPNIKKNSKWISLKNGSIICPRRSTSGCHPGILELMHILRPNKVSTLLEKAQELLKNEILMEYMTNNSEELRSCPDSQLYKASSRESSNDNYLYCVNAVDIEPGGGLKHFRYHWSKGEPVIVSNVLATGLGLSWEPMVMWLAICQVTNTNDDKLLDAKAINCLDWREVDVSFNNFFKGYMEGQYDANGSPQILKLKDSPPSNRHAVEFILCLPFKEYTHPQKGYLNLATKLPNSLKPETGPKMQIAYGFAQELGHGDSITKLQFNMSDVVNVLTHTTTADKVPLDDLEGLDLAEGGALWDIFRKEDIPKLEIYLKKCFTEFRQIFCLPLQQVIHPIHDQTFYLTMDHKRRLKKELGIQPWTFVQKLGDAVFVPAGCAYQVRNLKSCTSLTLDFVSPENVADCIRLEEDLRVLPENHRAKEENREVKKMALYTVEEAVKDLQYVLEDLNEQQGYTDYSKRSSTRNVDASFPSASGKQSASHTPIGVSTSQSQAINNTAVNLPTSHDKSMMIMDNNVAIDHILNERVEDYEEQQERNIMEKVSKYTNHIHEEIKDTDQQNNILEKVCQNVDKNDNMIMFMGNNGNVPVSNHTHQVQNDDEQHQKGKDFDDTNHIQEHQGAKDTDQQENVIEECEHDQYDEDEQNKNIQVVSRKGAKRKDVTYLEFGEFYDGLKKKKKDGKHRLQSGYKQNNKNLEGKQDINGNSGRVLSNSNMCHQCQRNDKGRVVRCLTCATKRYCIPCMTKWYPNMTEAMFAERCPVCRENCNCISCLRDVYPRLNGKMFSTINDDKKVQHSKYILQMILPFIKRLNEEHLKEMEIEAKIKGCSVSEVKLKKAYCEWDCQIYCDCCKTTIPDLHRSCPRCHYDLCPACCQELRDGRLPGESQNKSVEMDAIDPASKVKKVPEWKPLKNGSIRCPPRSMNGCRLGILELMHLWPLDKVPTLLEKAQELLENEKLMEYMSKISDSVKGNDGCNKHLCKASSRENSNDNYLYCPSAVDIKPEDVKDFQHHWAKGKPVMVSNVLAMGIGLSWEPMVMWRALRQVTNTKHDGLLNAKAIDCLDWGEVEVNLSNFFKWYVEGHFDYEGRPRILKLKDYPPSDRHVVEYISFLPFKDYTHPCEGYLNLATKLPRESLKPEMGPTTQIAYGFAQELGHGDSVTKLHFNICDVVNVLAHTATVDPGPNQFTHINKLKRKRRAQNQAENFVKRDKNVQLDDDISSSCLDRLNLAEGGALWDVFRKEDTPKLELYLKKHFTEFRHSFGFPLQQVIHPIHDQTFYLTMDHKMRLKEEFGIEPWTFVQKLGDAVFIPAGCAHQARNLKSCTNVTLQFISPENLTECIKLKEGLRVLPQDHRAKEDKLEVKKMALYAAEEAVRDLQCLLENLKEHQGYTDSSKRRNTPNVDATYPSASGKQPDPRTPIGVVTSQSRVINKTGVELPTKQIKSMMVMDDAYDQEDEQKKKRCVSFQKRSGSDHDPGNKKDDKKKKKQKKDGNLVKESCIIECGQKGTKEKASGCDDDELHQVVNVFDDKNYIQEHQGTKHMDQRENILKNVCENGRYTRSSCKSIGYDELFAERDMIIQQSSRKRSHYPSNKNAERKKDVKLDKKSGETEATLKSKEKPLRDEHVEENKDGNLMDKNAKTIINDDVITHSTNDKNKPQEEAIQGANSKNGKGRKDGKLDEELGIMDCGQKSTRDKTFIDDDDDAQQVANCVVSDNGIKDTDQQKNIVEEECENGRSTTSTHEIYSYLLDERKKSHIPSRSENAESEKDNVMLGINSGKTEATPMSTNMAQQSESTKPIYCANNMITDENEILYGPSNMCHQCQRNDKGRVIRCRECLTKRYCVPCMTTWYPNMTEEMFAERCPVCLNNCNCKSCLRDVQPMVKNKIAPKDDQRVRGSKYILQTLVPFLKYLNEEHIREMEFEAKIKGCSLSEVKLKKANCKLDSQICCHYCNTSIVDLHRSCPRCQYNLCLACCCELRDGHLQRKLITKLTNPGLGYCHGEKRNISDVKDGADPDLEVKEITELKSSKNGNIRCPPRSMNGCRLGVLELVHLWPIGMVPTLLEKAQELLNSDKLMEDMTKISDSVNGNDGGNKHICKASSRENSNDNYLYCPSAADIKPEDVKHFQDRWSNGEPIMVSNVLAMGLGLSWEPRIMWRAIRQVTNTNHNRLVDAKAISCLAWEEVDVNLSTFFKWYVEGVYDPSGWPRMVKLKDLPPSNRHAFEFISCLPFKEYTHPQNGYLNLASKLPASSLVPRTQIAFGFAQELGRGDSVTKLQFSISDAVNVLTHMETVTPTSNQLKAINMLKQRHKAQDQMELFGGDEKMVDKVPLDDVDTNLEGSTLADGGALWDIFRREDTPKLELYLKKYFKEFRHSFCLPLEQVIHPIHDQSFYLTMAHKRKLKEQFGIEPWTFVQKLGDAVFIPAGCVYQIRNLKSCTMVALDFVSPENFTECLKLTEELRLLPQNHVAKEDKWQVTSSGWAKASPIVLGIDKEYFLQQRNTRGTFPIIRNTGSNRASTSIFNLWEHNTELGFRWLCMRLSWWIC